MLNVQHNDNQTVKYDDKTSWTTNVLLIYDYIVLNFIMEQVRLRFYKRI